MTRLFPRLDGASARSVLRLCYFVSATLLLDVVQAQPQPTQCAYRAYNAFGQNRWISTGSTGQEACDRWTATWIQTDSINVQNYGGYPNVVATSSDCLINWPAGQQNYTNLRYACPPIVPPDGPPSPPLSCDANPSGGDPIYPLTGTERYTVDLGVKLSRQNLSATYDTAPRTPVAVAGTELAGGQQGSLGALWSSSVHKKLTLSAGGYGARVDRGGGRGVTFLGNGGGAFTADADVSDRLLSVSGGYRYVDQLGLAQEIYSDQGQLTRIDYAQGQSLVYVYSDTSTPPNIAPGAGYLLSIADPFGRTVRFSYDSAGRVSKVIDPAGRITTPGYGAAGNLVQIVWDDLKVRLFHYEETNHPWAMTGITSETGLRFSTISYDTQGRAIASELAGGVGHYGVSYGEAPTVQVVDTFDPNSNVVRRKRSWGAPVAPVVTTARGSAVALGIGVAGLTPGVIAQSQPAGSGCAASTSALSYDANGNVASKDDFNGTRTCYTHDLMRNLRTISVEGLVNTQACSAMTAANATLPVGARKISMQWHPEWRLETKRAEPKKVTTNVYNGQPDPFNGNAAASCAPGNALLPDGKPIVVLCKTVEQATTDVNGSQAFSAALLPGVPNRAWSYTYNQHGQVLTSIDPRGNTTTYSYYSDTSFTGADPNAQGRTVGDLQSMTNAAGHTTQYVLYDKAGRLLRSIDANGATTDNQYSPRGWLTEVSVTPAGGGMALVTNYGYEPTGLLKTVTYPGQGPISYGYDAAHRLTSITDSAGNSVTYTLDNAGNRLSEVTKDASGALTKTVTRAFDALNRVQSSTAAN